MPKRNRQQSKSRQRGFTLMEVLLVMAILVILGSLVTVSYITIQRNSKISTAKLQINNLQTALDVYHSDVGTFPGEIVEIREQPTDQGRAAKWQGPYMDKSIPLDPWGNAYQYEPQQDRFGRTIAVISSAGPDGQQGTDDDISNQSAT